MLEWIHTPRVTKTLQHAMNERHVLPSGENFVVSSNNPTIYKISNPNMTNLAQFLCSVYIQLRQHSNFCTQTSLTCCKPSVSRSLPISKTNDSTHYCLWQMCWWWYVIKDTK